MSDASTRSPMFSVVIPMYDSDPTTLVALMRSIRAQSWTDFECIMVDDGSPTRVPAAVARSMADDRFRVLERATNGGIANATNDAIAASTGEWIVFCDHDDLLHRRALELVARHATLHPDHELVHTDEQVVDAVGTPVVAHHKPDPSPERLLGQNYIAHLVAVRRRLLDRVARAPGRWLDADFEPCQDNDVVLRCTELAEGIGHVRDVLYSWRAGTTSLAAAADRKAGVARAVSGCTTAALARRDEAGEVDTMVDSPTTVRVHRPAPARARVVTVTIGTDDLAAEVAAVVEERRRADSTPARDLFVAFVPRATVSRSAIGPGGRELVDPLEPLLAQADRSGIAGPRVITDDHRLVSAGRVHLPEVRDLDQSEPADGPGPWGAFLVARECASLSPYGLVVRADVYDALGGLLEDPSGVEVHLDAAIVALCARLRRHGRVPIWTPLTTLTVTADHLDSADRLRRRDREVGQLAARVREIAEDPYAPIGLPRDDVAR